MQMNDGMLIDENVLMMAEALSKSDQELQINFAAISTCSSRSKYEANIIKINCLPSHFQREWTNVTQPPSFTSAVKNRCQIS
jgi:hypothetical protein